MNYAKHYESLISRARVRVVESPTETHHVIPACLGGSDARSNLVELTPEEHFVAHQLLAKIHAGNKQLGVAVAMMAATGSRRRSKNKEYGWLKRLRVASQTGVARTSAARASISAGRKMSEKARTAIALLHAAKVGVPLSAETRDKIRRAHLGRKASDETRMKISAAGKGRVLDDAWRAKLSIAAKGRRNALGATRSAETRARMSAGKTPEERHVAGLKAWATRRLNASTRTLE